MLDEKKIEEAQENIFEDKFLGNGEDIIFTNDEGGEDYREEMYYDGQIKEAISLGAHWAIQEFLKDLWHPASEEPEGYNEWILLYYSAGNFYSIHQVRDFENWEKFVEVAPFEQWAYLDDLLEQKGGENNEKT